MPDIRIILDGDNALPELKDKLQGPGQIYAVIRLVDGMESGASSVGIVVTDGKGGYLFSETSMSLFLAAADAFRAAEQVQATAPEPKGTT